MKSYYSNGMSKTFNLDFTQINILPLKAVKRLNVHLFEKEIFGLVLDPIFPGKIIGQIPQ